MSALLLRLLPAIFLTATAACAANLGDAEGGMDQDAPTDGTDNPPDTPNPPSLPVQTICDDTLGTTGADLARAMELCDGSLLSVELSTVEAEQAAVATYGDAYLPQAGAAMATIATGGISTIADKDLGSYDVQTSTPRTRPRRWLWPGRSSASAGHGDDDSES